MRPFDIDAVRAEFPALSQTVRGKPLTYLDSAATSQKPQAVLDAYLRVFIESNGNVHRGAHYLAAKATDGYEAARETVRRRLGAADVREIVFVRGTTEAINLVAHTTGRERLRGGGEVVVTGLEHHSNLVPWQRVAEEVGARLVHVPIEDDGSVSLNRFRAALGPNTRFCAFAHVSNALGTVLPVAEMTAAAHDVGALVLVDGAQAMSHLQPDVRAIGCDFYAFSGHKVFAPTGIGALYGRLDLLEATPPWQGGGEMVDTVTFERTTYAPPPMRFAAGTPNFAGAIALGVALEWLSELDPVAVAAHEADILAYGAERLERIPGLRLVGTAPGKLGVLAFVVEGVHASDLGTLLDLEGVAIRTGNHCAQPVMARFGVSATARASLALYNTRADIDRLGAALERALRMFR